MQKLPKIETVEQASEVLLATDEGQEITATSDKATSNTKKHSDHEFDAELFDYETGIISLRDASHIFYTLRLVWTDSQPSSRCIRSKEYGSSSTGLYTDSFDFHVGCAGVVSRDDP